MDEPETGTPSTAGWPLPDQSATPVPAPWEESVSTRAKEAPPLPRVITWEATAARTRSAPGPATPRQACSAATRAGEPRPPGGGGAGSVDPEQAAATSGDDRVSGEDFTAVGHGLQPSDAP